MEQAWSLLRIGWRNLWRQKRRTFGTVLAMATGVVASMVVIAISDGIFADVFDIVVRAGLGHVQIHAPGYPAERSLHEAIDDADALIARLESQAAAAGVSGRVYADALVGSGDRSAGARLTGIDPAREKRVTTLHEKILAGGSFLSASAQGEIVLGAGLAETLGAKPGDELVAVAQADDGSTGSALWHVCGIFKTGQVMTDRSGALVHLGDLHKLVGLEGRVHEIALVAPRRDGIDSLAAGARAAAGGLLVRTWRQVNPVIAGMMDLQNASMWIVLGCVFLVAAFGILNTLLMSVLERTRELGTLGALGMSPARVVAMVLCEAISLAAVATAAGVPAGLALDLWLARHGLDLSAFFPDYTWGGLAFSSVLRAEVRPEGVGAVVAGLFAVTLLSALWPAVRAARLRPVDAMRQE